ncbi:MAG TPA: hypothetical protein VGX91_14615 [Candidatus Cybelea sp.]|jgi:hypothetical protein|nr:hypothetical protein [Candidatus Cybelea sp.]
MKTLAPVLLAGGSFAGAAVLGLLLGIAAGQRFGSPLLAPAGLLAGAVFGAYSAYRLLAKSMA